MLTTHYTNNFSYLEAGLKLDVVTKDAAKMPMRMAKTINYKEMWAKMDAADDKSRKKVIWKCGATTNFTFGLLSHINANHQNERGIITDELLILQHKYEISSDYSGDSGSILFDTDGDVYGMMWGGMPGCNFTYVTPIQFILEDIQEVCQAETKFLV